ncbi:toll-like receptor 13 isoform X2 [Culicoides brevitarsis]|uniref:toll-like receptor 13 isoform X2 n=1 Tax=Culicoides brevitarsis TaxID=469753 RepID=UPI00307B1A93
MEQSKKFFTFLMIFIQLLHTITSSTNDVLRCTKVHNDNYYLGQVCILIDKQIDRSTDWNAQRVENNARPEQIRTVVFQESTVTYVPTQLFEKFTHVDRVYLNATELESIDSDSFDRATNLKEIYLNQNKLAELGARSFSKAKACHILDLSQNKLQHLDDAAFEGLSSVRKLLLNLNRISSLSEDVFAPLIQLNHLDLSNNNIEMFADNVFEHNRALQFVDLSYNSIKVLNINLKNNPLLTKFHVSSNVIENATILRKPNVTNSLVIYAEDNNWQCDVLNATAKELEPLNVRFTALQMERVIRENSFVNGIDCHATSFFDSANVNWPIVAFVVTAAIVFIIGAFVAIFCCRRRSRLYNYIHVLAK